MPSAFHHAFVQRGAVELLLLSVGAGLLGTWIVLRGLAFFSHAVGTAAFPGLVLADGLGFAAPLGALAAAGLFALGVGRLGRSGRAGYDSLTALVLVGFLALGVLLASDVFQSGSNVDTLLFGSLLVVGTRDIVLAGATSAAVLVTSFALGRRWLAVGFDPAGARALGLRSTLPDAVLLMLTALGIVSALSATGALLVSAIFVVPAATLRLVTRRLALWQAGSIALVAVEGIAGLWLSVEANVPPGAAIAVLAGAVFATVAAARMAVPLLRRRRLLVAAAGAVFLLALTGCGSGGGAEGRLRVVATTTQIGDWARRVGGSDVSVHQLLQPNTDPHGYEPRPADVQATAGAKIVLESGDNLDDWMEKVISAAGGNPRIVVLGNFVPVELPGETSGPEGSRYDPHWWHDPRNAVAAVAAIRRAFVRADPVHARSYRQRAAAYAAQLRRLDRGIAACLAAVPAAERKLVTDHDAFGYFARRYGLRVIGAVIPAQTTQAEPSAGEVARLIALVRREHVRAVFPEASLSSRLADAVARETGASSSYTLYGDTLGPDGSRGSTYVTMEQANADAIVRGLTGGEHGCRIRGIP